MHSRNGNSTMIDRNLVFLQLNYSHCNFATKIEELRVTIFENKADIVVISESNYDTEDEDVKKLRESKFPEFQFVDKLTAGNKVAEIWKIDRIWRRREPNGNFKV